MPTDTSPDVPLLSRVDTALLRRTAAALVVRSGEYGDLFVEEVRQAEILGDGLEPGAVVTGGGRGAAARVLSPLGQRHTAVDGLDPDRIAHLPRLVRERSDGAAPTAPAATSARSAASAPAASTAVAGNQSPFPEPALGEGLAFYPNAVPGAVGGPGDGGAVGVRRPSRRSGRPGDAHPGRRSDARRIVRLAPDRRRGVALGAAGADCLRSGCRADARSGHRAPGADRPDRQ